MRLIGGSFLKGKILKGIRKGKILMAIANGGDGHNRPRISFQTLEILCTAKITPIVAWLKISS